MSKAILKFLHVTNFTPFLSVTKKVETQNRKSVSEFWSDVIDYYILIHQ